MIKIRPFAEDYLLVNNAQAFIVKKLIDKLMLHSHNIDLISRIPIGPEHIFVTVKEKDTRRSPLREINTN